MTTFEATIPTKKRLDVRDALETDHNINATITDGRNGVVVITVAAGTKGAKSAIQAVLATVGGSLVDDQE